MRERERGIDGNSIGNHFVGAGTKKAQGQPLRDSCDVHMQRLVCSQDIRSMHVHRSKGTSSPSGTKSGKQDSVLS